MRQSLNIRSVLATWHRAPSLLPSLLGEHVEPASRALVATISMKIVNVRVRYALCARAKEIVSTDYLTLLPTSSEYHSHP